MKLTWENISESDLETSHLLPEGVYDFEVIEARYDLARDSKNPIIRLKLKLFDNQGSTHIIFSILIAQGRMQLILKHFLESIGMPEKYEAKNLSADECVGKCGKAYIVREPRKPKKNDVGFYDAKNSVKDYITPEMMSKNFDSNKQSQGLGEPLNDDIPF